MKKGLKILSTSLLISTLAFAGCNDKTIKNVSRIEKTDEALLENLTGDTSNYKLLDVYNALISSDENSTASKKLVSLVADNILNLNSYESEWKERYDSLINEKLEEEASSDDYKVNGVFSEKLFIDTLKAEGYSITCQTGVDYGTVDNLSCDYKDFIDRNFKYDAVTTLLKEKYLLDVTFKDRKVTLTNKKIRDVEYFSLSSALESTYSDIDVREYILSLRDKIANHEVVNFETIENEFKELLKSKVTEEYNKIGTSEDSSQSIANTYTATYTREAVKGYEEKISAVDELNFTDKLLIDSDSGSSAIISEDITSTLLSITDPTSTDFDRKVIAVEDDDEVTHYYLVSPNAGSSIDEKDVLISESSDSKYIYSIVRFTVINSDTTNANDLYRAAKLIASTSSLASGAVDYYLKEEKDTITVYDDDLKEYLKSLYPEAFAD